MRARPPRLPEFEFGRRLGGGSTCEVFSALDTSGCPGWAVKFLRDDAAEDPINVQLLKQEARVGMAVRHPNLVRVLRLGPEENAPRYLVMERVAGQSLRSILNRHGWLDGSTAIAIGYQVAGALTALHAAGYVHGDVKPDNLHVDSDRSCTLLDLGFAHRADGDDYFGTGFILGTANYVAPELCQHPERDGPEADVFSLGVTLFELLTGELPYPSADVEMTMLLHRDHAAESLRRWRGSWPDALATLVNRMLARDPDARPSAPVLLYELTELSRRIVGQKSAA